MSWLSICFLCTWWTLCFTPCLKQQVYVVLRVHYKSMKCDVLFSQGSVRTIFRWGGHYSYMNEKFLPLYNSAKIIKINGDFPKLWSQMYCHLFMVHSVQRYAVGRLSMSRKSWSFSLLTKWKPFKTCREGWRDVQQISQHDKIHSIL